MPHTRTIAVLVANPALASVLCMVLAGNPSLRIRSFESELALSIYMRLAPVDVVVLDFDAEAARADQVTRDLRADPGIESPDFQVIALASTVGPNTKARSLAAGIDEIIVKPMSPRYLLERVLARLARRLPVKAARTMPPPLPHYTGNVIPLWTSARPMPTH